MLLRQLQPVQNRAYVLLMDGNKGYLPPADCRSTQKIRVDTADFENLDSMCDRDWTLVLEDGRELDFLVAETIPGTITPTAGFRSYF